MEHKNISDKIVLEKMYEGIVSDTRPPVGDASRTKVWDEGWGENLTNYKKTNDIKYIQPKFVKAGEVIRYNSNLVIPKEDNAEEILTKELRIRVFNTYFKNVDNIYEFGAGTGVNMVTLAQMFPEKNLYGTDFVENSVELINLIAEKNKYNIKASLFNMINPDMDFEIKENSGILTLGSIEQINGKVHNFIKFLLEKKPKICLHIEPIYELYDMNNPVDALAMVFHQKRGYSTGFLPTLKLLEFFGKLKIICVEKSSFGNKFSDGFSVITWKID